MAHQLRRFAVFTLVGALALACNKPEGEKSGESDPGAGSKVTSGAPSGAGATAIRIGVLNDMSGPYADLSGEGSVHAARMAVEEVGGKIGDKPIEIISADHRNKPDVGSAVARRWMENDAVDLIIDVPTSSVALAVTELTRAQNKVFIASGPAAAELTGAACTPNTVHWTYDTYALANGTGREVVRTGGKSWYFITADYAFGHALERDVSAVVRESGGKVVGSVRHPLNNSDFSSFLMQAQGSKAQVIGMANAGGDVINTIKQASEFGLGKDGQKLAGLLVFISDVHALGLDVAGGLLLTSSFYWDRDDQTRAWSKKFGEGREGRMPTMVQAGVYAGVRHYLKAVKEIGDESDGRKVVETMKRIPTDDPLFGKGTIDANGRKRHPMYLYQVKTPDESKADWDYYKLVRPIPADQAFQDPARTGCKLVGAGAGDAGGAGGEKADKAEKSEKGESEKSEKK
jgi:branched-chain amino acid transport system substrate-binding protein